MVRVGVRELKDRLSHYLRTVRQGQIVEVTVRGNLIDGKIETLYAGKGSLRVKSTPMRCTVHFAGMVRDKIYQTLNMTHIPAGEYKIVIAIPGRSLGKEILILDRHRTLVEVDFKDKNRPIVVSYVPH